MMTTTSLNPRRLAAGILLLLLLLGAATTAFFQVEKGTSAGADATFAAPSGCTHLVHYWVQPNNDFGPAVTQTAVSDQYANRTLRFCTDTALLTAAMKYEGIGDFGSLVGVQLTIRADQIAADPAVWMQDIQAILQHEQGLAQSDTTLSGTYQTMYMVAQAYNPALPGGGAPLIEATSITRGAFPVLQIGNYYFKLDCGFQPVAQSFPGVTQMTYTPFSTTTYTPSSGCSCSGGGGTSGCTTNCGTTPPKCNCTTPAQVQIPVQSQNPGVNTGPVPGSTYTPPATNPSPPPTNQPLPPDVGGPGYNTGSGTGSGTTGGTTCVGGTCTQGSGAATGTPGSSASGDGNGTQGGTGGGSTSTGGGTVPTPP